MIEYKKERVSPDNEDIVINTYSSFGWTLCSSNEIYNENTEITGIDINTKGEFMSWLGNDGISSKSTVNVRQRRNITNYSSLVFARNTDMPNYIELRSLEEKYNRYDRCAIEPKKPIASTVISVIAWVIIIISIMTVIFDSNNSAEIWEIIVCVAVFLLTVPLVISKWVKYKKKSNAYDYNIFKMAETQNEAKKLLY